MDDDNSSTRLVACKVLSLLLQNGPSIFTGKSSHTIKIEDSLYFAHHDKISESKCILVEGTLKDKVNNIDWTLEKSN